MPVSTDTLTREDVDLDLDASDEDPAERAHILHPRYTPAMLMEARFNGTSVEAMCGYVWVPVRDPKKVPLCARCKAIHEMFDGRPLEYS